MNRLGPCVSCGEAETHIIHGEFGDLPSGRRMHTYFPAGGVPSTREEARDWFRALRRDKEDDLMAVDLLDLLRAATEKLETLSCAVADDWTTWCKENFEEYKAAGRTAHCKNLDMLEIATRSSPLRKVKP